FSPSAATASVRSASVRSARCRGGRPRLGASKTKGSGEDTPSSVARRRADQRRRPQATHFTMATLHLDRFRYIDISRKRSEVSVMKEEKIRRVARLAELHGGVP